MALFKRKKKKSEPEAAAEERDLVTPSDLSDDDFRNYINERRNAPADEDEEIDDFTPVPQDETEDVPEDEADAEESAPGEEAEEEPAPPFRSFATEDEYNSVIQKAINEARSKWDLDNQAVKARYERMDRIARAYFPDDDNAFDALGDDLEAQYEERAGRSYDDYLDEEHRNDSASKWDAQEQAKADAITNREKIINKWVADAGNLKVIEPDFELEEALKNSKFTDALLAGDDVFAAYAKAYKGDPDPEPEPEGEGESEEKPADEPEKEPEQRKAVPQNGDSKSRRSGERRIDPSKMSSEEFKKYISRLKNG